MISKKIKVYSQILEKIKLSKNIALISHINPDLDTIGRAMGFYQIIKDNFLYKNIDLICFDKIPTNYNFIFNINKYKTDFDPKNYDLIIFFDTSSKELTGWGNLYPNLFDKKTYNTISIDHHITNTLYAKQNIVNATYTSTTMIVWEIFYLLGYKITSISATYLLNGIYTDSSGFKNSSTDKMTFFVASKLVELGGDITDVVNKFFKSNKLNKLRLYGEILSSSFIDDNNILYSYINQTLIENYNSSYDEIKGILEILNSISGIKYTVFLTQKGDYIRRSLRTLRDDIDLSKLASKYGGGGHKKASGFTICGQIKEIKTLNIKI